LKLKSTFFLIPIFLLCFLTPSAGAGIHFFEGTWNEAVKAAQTEHKLLFVDFYATWCGPCKYMSKKIFTKAEVGKYYNEHFIAFSVDAENEEQDLVNAANLQAYPTLGYYDAKGNKIYAHVGILDVDEMLLKGKQVVNFKENMQKVEDKTADSIAFRDCLSILKFSNYTKAKALAVDYLNSIKNEDLSQEGNWFFVKEFASNYHTKQYKYVLAHPQEFIKFGDAFSTYYQEGSEALMQDAVKEQDYAKLKLRKKYLVTVYKALDILEKPEDFYTTLVDIQYFDGIKDTNSFFSTTVAWLEKYQQKNYVILSQYAIQIADRISDPEKLGKAKYFAQKALELENNPQTNYALSYVLFKSGEKEEALRYGKIAREKSKDERSSIFLEKYLKQLQ